MANETTTTTITGFINTAIIQKVLLNYAIDANVALPRLRMDPIAGQGTKTAAFAIPTKDTAGAITEATGMSNTGSGFTTSNTTVAVSEVGVLRQLTKLANRTSILGEQGLFDAVVEDGKRLCLEKAETDAWAQWANASKSTGTSGAAMTVANLADAVAQQTINKACGPMVGLLAGTQQKNLRDAVVASTATWFATGTGNQVADRVGDDGYMGIFLGIPLYTNNLAATANAAVDKVGVVMVDGASKPENAATGVALGWLPEVAAIPQPQFSGGQQVAITMAYGLGEVADFNYTKIVTVA